MCVPPEPPPRCGYAHRRKPKPPEPAPPKEPSKPPEAPKEQPKQPEAPKEQPKQPETPKEQPKQPEAPKEQPKEPETPKEPEAPKEQPKQPDAPKDQPSTPPPSSATPDDTRPAPPPPASGGSDGSTAPSDPANPSAGGAARRSGGAGPSITRPSLGFGLQPRLQDMTLGNTTNLLGLVEPWEVWWTRNRINYLKFRQPIEFIRKSPDGYVIIAKEYDQVFNLFTKALGDKDPSVRVAAAYGLSKLGEIGSSKVTGILEKAFYNETQLYPENNILLALGLMGSAEHGFLLKKIAQYKEEPEINRCYAILGLGYIKNDEEVVKILRELLSHPDKPEVTAAAALALGQLKDASAVQILARHIQRGVLYQGEKYDRRVRAYAALGLGRIGTREALNELKKSLDDKDKAVQESVAIALGAAGLPEALGPLSRLLSSRDSAVRGFAAISLSRIPDQGVYPLLLNAFQNVKDHQVDGMIVLALGLSGDKRAVPELQKILATKTKRPLIKGAAAIALGLLKDTSAVPLITDLLDKTADPVLSAYLILSLGMIGLPAPMDIGAQAGDNQAVEIIRKKWADISSKTSSNIAYTNMAVALAMLGARDEHVLPQIRKHLDKKEIVSLRQHALHSAGLIGGQSMVGELVKLYDDETNPQIRQYVISSLGFLVDANDTPLITKVTAGNDYNIFMLIIEQLLPLPLW